jgi:heme o synthase
MRIGQPLKFATGRSLAQVADYVSLAKPRLNVLIAATSAVGYCLGASGVPNLLAMGLAVAGTALVAVGCAALNQVYERDTDRLMQRTRMRPLPDGRLAPGTAWRFGVVLTASGLTLLAARANATAAVLALVAAVIYLGVYTPMKRRSSLATLVGAVPGALPPLIGWVAARGAVSIGGWVLFAVVFLWQIPHCVAIGWLYRDDYRRAGFPMLPFIKSTWKHPGQRVVVYAAPLAFATFVPTLAGISGLAYLWVALGLGVALLGPILWLSRVGSDSSARWLFFGSICYLPMIWLSMVLDRLF